MGIFDSVSRRFGSLRSLSDSELEDEREVLRQQYVSGNLNLTEADELYNEMLRYDEEMIRRSNETYERENPGAGSRHREHGWYLSND